MRIPFVALNFSFRAVQGTKVTRWSNESNGMKAFQAGRTLEEARKLIERSFGNYVGSNVLLASKEEVTNIQKEIELLTLEVSDDAIDRKSRKLLSGSTYKEIADMQEQLRVTFLVPHFKLVNDEASITMITFLGCDCVRFYKIFYGLLICILHFKLTSRASETYFQADDNLIVHFMAIPMNRIANFQSSICGLRVPKFQAEKSLQTEKRRDMQLKRISALKDFLEEMEHGNLPFISLQYQDSKGVYHTVPAVYLGRVDSLSGSEVKLVSIPCGPFPSFCFYERLNVSL